MDSQEMINKIDSIQERCEQYKYFLWNAPSCIPHFRKWIDRGHR